jgi:F0F1-type ATP synthase membrane subunit a
MDSIFSFLMQAESPSKGLLNVSIIISLLATIGIPLIFYLFIRRKKKTEEKKYQVFHESMKNLLQKISK